MRKAVIALLLGAVAATPAVAQDRYEKARERYERQTERNQQRYERREARQAMERPVRHQRQERVGGHGGHDHGGATGQHVDRPQNHRGLHREYRREHRELHRENPSRGEHREWHREVNRDHRDAHRDTHREVHRDLNSEHRDLHRADPTRREHRQWHREATRDHNGYHRQWDRSWRQNSRYDWQRYRYQNRDLYRWGSYYSPYRGHRYNRLSIGLRLGSPFYSSRYWIDDPWQYRLPAAYPGTRWVRYYDDVLLVDLYTGEVIDVIYDFFW